MNKKDLIKLGSRTARNGFRNEDDIVKKCTGLVYT